MARKKRKDESGGASWMETYSDMVTLLLTFFIMLYAMSTIDAKKYSTIVESFSKAMNTEAYYQQMEEEVVVQDEEPEANDMDAFYALLKEYVDDNDLSEQVELSKSEEYVFIRF